MRSISLKLPDDLLAELTSQARARRVTKSQLVREGLERVLHARSKASEKSCFDMARDLAGAVKNLPEDLADNPAYMDGFGE
jgi:predicted transcriptional regulator